jgi:hypothetical protein
MRVYTYSEARQNLASLLERADQEGEVRIKRKDGQIYVIRPQPRTASPLNIQGVDIDVDTVEIVALIREGRERFGRGGPATTSE